LIRPIHWVLELLFPPKCAFCHKLLPLDSEPICDDCAKELLRCEPTEHKGEFFSTCVAALPYEDPVRSSILRYKFSGRQEYAKTYAPLLAACIQDKLAGRFDLIAWVPVSAKRKRQRGYDQAELLARETAALLRVPVQPVLKKLRNNPAQSGLPDASARRANVLGVYRALHPDELRDQRILLIDDVVTTSATLAECSRVLLTAGAKEVVCAALAAAGATKG
jgi:ComF family protein